uniref:Female-specific protein transformer n=1 Tax=Glossina brevipalpis TaxID=37001 RepID=A0A1A9WE94_9MUSC
MNTLAKILDSAELRHTTVKIQQDVPNYLISKGPPSIVRTAALNENICIKRRHGEGSEPLFARAGIAVNPPDRKDTEENLGAIRGEHKRHASEATSESSSSDRSPERSVYTRRYDSDKKRIRKSKSPDDKPTSSRYVKGLRERKKSPDSHSSRVRNITALRKKSKSKSPPPIHKRISKVPYFRDEVREQDRLRRLYGKEQRKSHSKSPSRYKRRYRSPTRYHRTSSSRRSRSKDNKYRHSRESRRRSKSRSRTRSPRRRNHSRSNREHSSPRGREHKTLNISTKNPQLPAQFITIPVALPAGSTFPYAGFHHLPPPPTHYPPYPVMPVMPQRQFRPIPRRQFMMPPAPFLGPSGRQRFVARNDWTNQQTRQKKSSN